MDHGSSQNLVSAYTFTVLNENKLLFLLEARWKGGGGGVERICSRASWRGQIWVWPSNIKRCPTTHKLCLYDLLISVAYCASNLYALLNDYIVIKRCPAASAISKV